MSNYILDRSPNDDELTAVPDGDGYVRLHGRFLVCRYNGYVDVATFTRYRDNKGNVLPGFWDDRDARGTVSSWDVAGWQHLRRIDGTIDDEYFPPEGPELRMFSIGRCSLGLSANRKGVIRWVDGREVRWK